MSLATASFAISPTSLSTYFLLDCERYLRWNTPIKKKDNPVATLSLAEEKSFQIPQMPFKKSPLFEALTQGGFRWEEEIVNTYLQGRLVSVEGRTPCLKERFSYTETLAALKTIQPGQWIYQATLRATDSFYQRFGLDSAQIHFSECYPDLIYCTASGKLRIVDAKASERLKITHKIQTGIYAFLLDELLKTEGIDRSVDLNTGGIWLGNQPTPSLFNMNVMLPHVEHLLKTEVPRILAQTAQDAPWHVNFKCEWCQWFNHCKQQALEQEDISLIPYLSPDNKRFLVEQAIQSSALRDLNTALADPDLGDLKMAASISLKAKGGILFRQSEALLKQTIIPQLARSLALPKNEDISVLLAVEREPSTKEVYAISILVSLSQFKQELAQELQIPEFKPVCFIAESPTDCTRIQHEAITYLHELFTRVDAYNRQHEWLERVSLQTYSFDAYEKVNLTDMLIKALESPLHRKALDLLFFFRHLDNILEEEHPDPAAKKPDQLVSFPMVSLLSALRELLALPIPLAWQLGRILPVLMPQQADDKWHYKYEDFSHYPLSNYLDSDLIHYAWDKNEAAMNKLNFAMQTRVRGLNSALIALRKHPAVKPMLFAYASKFLLPKTSEYQNAILSKLAFMNMNENIVRALEARKARTQDERQRNINQIAFRIKCLGGDLYQVLTPTNQLKEDTFSNYLLWPPTQSGEESQARYDDLAWYNRGQQITPKHLERSLANIERIHTDPVTGMVLEIELKLLDETEFFGGKRPELGSEWLLGKVYRNTITARIFKALTELDTNDGGHFSSLLQTASSSTWDLPLPAQIQDRILVDYPNWKLTSSQEQALLSVLRQNLTLIWGPPGTGKTHFIATTLAGLLKAHQDAYAPFRILVTAFTKTAMLNVMKKLAKRLEELGVSAPLFIIGDADNTQSITEIDRGHFFKTFKENEIVVIGSTTWQYEQLKSRKTTPPVNLLVIDEASQMTVPEAAQLWQVLDHNSRVMVVGDHYQLPPIIADEYPEPEGLEPLLTRSIFEAFQHSENLERDQNPESRQIVYPLLECWRMNQTLNRFSAEELYTMKLEVPLAEGGTKVLGYDCANAEVAQQRMDWQAPTQLTELQAYLLDPDYPLTLCVLEGLQTLQENLVEADLVAELSALLRQSLLHKGEVMDEGELYDQYFWAKKLFIVSPHHVQIMAIKRSLSRAYGWESPPLVGTVDKMQGQEADVVIVSYGLSDVEAAIQEKDFIYDLNRLNVAITRAKSKCLVFLPRPLLEGSPAVLDSDRATRGLAYMQRLEKWVAQGENKVFPLEGYPEGVKLQVYRR